MGLILRNLKNSRVIQGDPKSEIDVKKIISILKLYRTDGMGEGINYTADETLKLVDLIKNSPNIHFFLIYFSNKLAGGSICFESFSSFYAKKVINIHDFFIKKEYRRKSLGTALMNEIINYSEKLNCSKVTLEVREDNMNAQKLYKKSGFIEATPNMLFWHKSLDNY